MASSVATPLERQFGRIAGVTEMTSTSSLGSTTITLQFDLNRNIDAAARDVQAAINAARGQLPANLPNNPSYRKVNPADAPILLLALTSDVVERGADVRRRPRRSCSRSSRRSQGVGQVVVGGGALPAVRVDVNPTALNNYGLGLEDVRTALAAANANRPKGAALRRRAGPGRSAPPTSCCKAAEYQPLIVALPQRRGRSASPTSADVTDSVEDVRTGGLANGKPAVLVIIFRQPGANIIDTVDRVRGAAAAAPGRDPADDRPARRARLARRTIRASVRDVELTLADLDRAGDPGRVPVPAQRARRRSSRASPCRSR